MLLSYRMEILFWFRKLDGQPNPPPGHPASDLKGSICCRITLNGERTEIGKTGANCWKSEWDAGREVIRLRTMDVGEEMLLNHLVGQVRSKLHSVHMLLISSAQSNGDSVEDITALDVKKAYFDQKNGYKVKVGVQFRAVLSEWIKYDKQREVSRLVSESTHKNHRNYVENISAYLKQKRRELQVKDIDDAWMEDFRMCLSGERGFSPSHIVKHLQIVKQSLIWAKKRKIIRENPIADYLIDRSDDDPDTTCLSHDEVKRLAAYDPSTNPVLPKQKKKILEEERDALLFTCVSGMHDGDYKEQRYTLTHDILGYWLEGKRQKTGQKFKVPLDPIGVAILRKYGGIGNLPTRSNQKRNEHLKLLGVLAGIATQMSTKIGRKTFTDRMLNDLDFDPIDVAYMLGHKDLTSLKHYVKVKPHRIAHKFRPRDMEGNEEAA
jgi:site-specific recombinase XerD